jgi:4-aminobutyrate aminotransferase-like enzyme
LRALAKSHPALSDLRAVGLFLGQDIVDANGAPDAALTGRIVNGLREARVLISATGPRGHVLKIRPPMVFSKAHVDYFIERLDGVMKLA